MKLFLRYTADFPSLQHCRNMTKLVAIRLALSIAHRLPDRHPERALNALRGERLALLQSVLGSADSARPKTLTIQNTEVEKGDFPSRV